MTAHRPGAKVREWIAAGQLTETSDDIVLEHLMTLKGYHDVSWRHEALVALRIIRHEATTGEPF